MRKGSSILLGQNNSRKQKRAPTRTINRVK
jgi:hypothetical protein